MPKHFYLNKFGVEFSDVPFDARSGIATELSERDLLALRQTVSLYPDGRNLKPRQAALMTRNRQANQILYGELPNIPETDRANEILFPEVPNVLKGRLIPLGVLYNENIREHNWPEFYRVRSIRSDGYKPIPLYDIGASYTIILEWILSTLSYKNPRRWSLRRLFPIREGIKMVIPRLSTLVPNWDSIPSEQKLIIVRRELDRISTKYKKFEDKLYSLMNKHYQSMINYLNLRTRYYSAGGNIPKKPYLDSYGIIWRSAGSSNPNWIWSPSQDEGELLGVEWISEGRAASRRGAKSATERTKIGKELRDSGIKLMKMQNEIRKAKSELESYRWKILQEFKSVFPNEASVSRVVDLEPDFFEDYE